MLPKGLALIIANFDISGYTDLSASCVPRLLPRIYDVKRKFIFFHEVIVLLRRTYHMNILKSFGQMELNSSRYIMIIVLHRNNFE